MKTYIKKAKKMVSDYFSGTLKNENGNGFQEYSNGKICLYWEGFGNYITGTEQELRDFLYNNKPVNEFSE
jgi:hypothetical protein